MIEITELRKSYHGIEVLHVPELHIKRGESVGLVGNNGAGKTTLLSLLLDLIQPDGGTVAGAGAGERRRPMEALYLRFYRRIIFDWLPDGLGILLFIGAVSRNWRRSGGGSDRTI